MIADSRDVLYAWKITQTGKGEPLSLEDLDKTDLDCLFKWIHLDVSDESIRWFLESVDSLSTTIVDAILAEETRPRIEEFSSGNLVILRGINHNDPEEPEDMVSLRVWIEKGLVISAQRRSLKSIGDIDTHLQQGKTFQSTGDLLTFLLSRLTDRMEPVLAELEDRIDNVEESVNLNPSQKEQQELTAIRRESILYRRFISPQRDVVTRMLSSGQDWISRSNHHDLQEVSDHLIRYIENLDTIRERAQIIKDELTNVLSYQMNKNLYVLSIVTAIFLPLGLLTGLFGINLAGMPGANHGPAFYIFCGCLSVVAVVQLLIFKRLKMF